MTRNKKADLAGFVFIVLVALIVFSLLGIFYKSKWDFKGEVYTGFLDNFAYVKMNIEEDSLFFHSEDVIFGRYYSIARNNQFMKNSCPMINNLKEFCEIDPELNDFFKTTLQESLDKRKFESGYENANIETKLENNNFNVKVSGLITTWDIKQTPTTWKIDVEDLDKLLNPDSTMQIEYSPEINFSFNFNDLGVNSFEEIWDYEEVCRNEKGKTKEEFQACLNEKLKYFDANVLPEIEYNSQKYYIVRLTSKRKFLIDDELKSIEIKFAVQKLD